MATQLVQHQKQHLLADDDEKNDAQIEDSIFIFQKQYRECGLRIRVDELTYVDTANQRYGINLVLDRTWLATQADLKQWAKLRNGDDDIANYQPDYVPFISYINLVATNLSEPLLWEQTSGKFIIQKSRFDNKFYNRYKVKGQYEFTEEFEVENYPFDLQDLSIIIGPESATIEEQRLVPHHIVANYFSINRTWSSITDWDIIDLFAKEYTADTTKYYKPGRSNINEAHDVEKRDPVLESYANYKIQVKRKWVGIMSRVCVWMLLLGILSFCIFSHSIHDVGDRMAFGITMVLTIVAFQFVITSSLPQVNYLTLIDKYNLFIFGCNVAFIIESAFLGIESVAMKDWATEADNICIAFFATFFFVGHLIFMIVCYFKNKEEWEKLGPADSLEIEHIKQSNTRLEYADKSYK